jgi:hypothetical protein
MHLRKDKPSRCVAIEVPPCCHLDPLPRRGRPRTDNYISRFKRSDPSFSSVPIIDETPIITRKARRHGAMDTMSSGPMSVTQPRLASVPFHHSITTEQAFRFSSDRRDEVASDRLHTGLLTLAKVVLCEKSGLWNWGVVTDVLNRIAPLDGATTPVCRWSRLSLLRFTAAAHSCGELYINSRRRPRRIARRGSAKRVLTSTAC